jgi:hypothetical protein
MIEPCRTDLYKGIRFAIVNIRLSFTDNQEIEKSHFLPGGVLI